MVLRNLRTARSGAAPCPSGRNSVNEAAPVRGQRMCSGNMAPSNSPQEADAKYLSTGPSAVVGGRGIFRNHEKTLCNSHVAAPRAPAMPTTPAARPGALTKPSRTVTTPKHL